LDMGIMNLSVLELKSQDEILVSLLK